MKKLHKLETLSHGTLRRVTTYASVFVATSLIIAKLVAYLYTDSVALLSSLVDSGVDLLASIITAIGVARALQPPDRDHRFGHGKAESLAAMAQAAFILGSSVLLFLEAINRFVKPRSIENPEIGYVVMGFAIVMTMGLLLLQSYTVRKTKSLAIGADRLHYVGDILINLAVVATLVFQGLFDQPWIDPLFAIGIAASMSYGAVKIACKALDVLMDTELPDADRQAIISISKSVPGVLDVHDLRTRSDSEHIIIEMHVEMDASLPLKKAHDIAEAVMIAVEKHYPGSDILIHQDPAGIVEKRLDIVIEKNDPHQV